MKSSKDEILARHQKIIELLKLNKAVRVQDLAEQLCVNQITIRRDLALLENSGIARRFHGGASIAEDTVLEEPLSFEQSNNLMKKKLLIAEKACSYIQTDDTIFINSSSTALLILNFLHEKNVTIVTNNGKALQMSKPSTIDLILTGGDVYEKKLSLVGEFALNSIHNTMASKCFLGVSGISLSRGITTSVSQETSVNKAMLNRCNGPRFVLADSSKIGIENNFVTCDISLITNIITDAAPDNPEIIKMMESGIAIDFV